jgi:hypothetical protein
MAQEPKTPCRTPAEGRDGVTNIPTWKFDLLRAAILKVVDQAGPEGQRFSELKDSIKPLISNADLEKLGSLGWHMTCVKLEMEVAGDLKRLDMKGPQRIVRA